MPDPIDEYIQAHMLDVTDPIHFAAEEFWCAMQRLDDLGVPRTAHDRRLSLVGRIDVLIGVELRKDE